MTAKALIVCVDDDDAIVASVARTLRRDPGLEVRSTTEPEVALAWVTEDEVAVLVSDYEMPSMTGAQLAGRARRVRPETVRILLTGMRTFETAIDGINQGEIFRFIPKPWDTAALLAAVRDGVARNAELLELSGERARREQRRELHRALEAEYPGITVVDPVQGVFLLTDDPWAEAQVLGLHTLTRKLER